MSKIKKIKVAITGNISSGKSTFANFIAEAGYTVISADDISKEILANDLEVRKAVIQEFGASAFDGKKINKLYLADTIFSDPKKLKKINSILHPQVRTQIDKLTTKYFKTTNVVFIETALVYESRIVNLFDYIVLITADQNIRMKRSLSDKKLSEESFQSREKNQIEQEKKQQKADFVFSNNGSKNELKLKAKLLIKLLVIPN
jgi:dephospho-CoA kinase